LALKYKTDIIIHMNFIKKNWHRLVLLTCVLFLSAPTLYAQTPPASTCNPPGTICNPIPKIGSIPILIQTILTGAIKIGIPVLALAIIYCGFLFVKAQGKPEELTKAKDALMWTLIGAAVLLGSLAIATMISNTVLAL
jgi:hypothetical protein